MDDTTEGVYRPEENVLLHIGTTRKKVQDTCQRLNMYPAAAPAAKPDKPAPSKSIKKPELARDHVG